MLWRRLQQALKARAQIRRAADVRLCACVRAVECKDGCGIGKLSERGFSICRVEEQGLVQEFTRHGLLRLSMPLLKLRSFSLKG
jgi:hypothetical protein